MKNKRILIISSCNECIHKWKNKNNQYFCGYLPTHKPMLGEYPKIPVWCMLDKKKENNK